MTATAPTGSVTLMFTDIEGSTKLLERLRDGYALVLEQQRDLLRAAFESHEGFEVDTQGDSFLVAFSSAVAALLCATEIQRSIAAHEWPLGADLRVRIGIHAGRPVLASTGYVGVDVHRGARIGAAAHGGQVLLSRATRDQLDPSQDERFSFDDLGMHRFKGLTEPTAVLGLRIEGLTTDFPPIRASAPEDEPPAPGDPPYKGLLRFEAEDSGLYFGREALVAQVAAAVRSQPFIAVVGASGSGKSSLLRAGVIPVVSDAGSFANVTVMTPTADPLEAGAEALEGSGLLVVDQFEELFTLCHDDRLRHDFVARLMNAAQGGLHVLITLRADFYVAVSQFPELRQAVADNQFYIGPMERDDLRRAIEEPARRGGWEIAPGLVDLLLRDIGNEPGALPLLSHALLETWHRRRGSRMTLKGYFESGEVSGAIARTADRLYAELPDAERHVARNILLRLTELGEGAQDTRRRAALVELVPSGGAQGTNDVLRRLIDARLVTVDDGTAEVAHEALIREWPLLRGWLEDDREGLRVQRQLTDAAGEWHALAHESSLLFRGARLATAREWSAAHPGTLTDSESEFLAASIDAEESDARERAEQQQRELEAAQRAAEAERRRAEDQAAAARRLRRRAYILVGAVVIAAGLGVAAVAFALRANEQTDIARDQTTIAQEQQAEAEAQRATADEQRTLAEQRQRDAEEQRSTATSRQLAVQAAANLPDLDLSLLLSMEALRHSDSLEARQSLLNGLLSEPQLQALARIPGRAERTWFWGEGNRVATISADGQVRTWSIIDGGRLEPGAEFSTSDHVSVEPSPDGSRLATLLDDELKVWSIESGEMIDRFVVCGDGGHAAGVAWSPDGSRLAASCGAVDPAVERDPDGITLIDLVTHESTVFGAGYARDLVFSPDGRLVAVLTTTLSSSAAIVGLVNGEVHDSRATSIMFDTVEGGTAVQIWNVSDSSLVSELPPGNGEAFVAFSPDSRTVAFAYIDASDRPRLDVWGVDGPDRLISVAMDRISNGPPIFGLDGRTIAVTTDEGGRLLDAETGNLSNPLVGCSELRSPQFSPDGTQLVGVCRDIPTEPTVFVYDIYGGLARKLAAHDVTLADMAFGSDGRFASIAQSENGATSTVALWQLDLPNRLSQTSATLTGQDSVVGLSGDGRTTLEYSTSGEVFLRDAVDGGLSREIRCPITSEGASGSQLVQAAGSYIACVGGSGEDIEVHDWDDGRLLVTLKPDAQEAGAVRTMQLSPDGRTLFASFFPTNGDETSTAVWSSAWSTEDGTERLRLQDGAEAVAFSADGSRMAIGIDKEIAVFETGSWSRLATLAGHEAQVGALAFDLAGDALASGDANGVILLWNTTTWQQSGAPLRAHESAIARLAFGPGNQLASWDQSWLIYLWDTARRLAMGPLPSSVLLGFQPEGDALLGVSDDAIIGWPLGEDAWRADACAFANRNLTDEEWQLYLPDEDYRQTCPP